MNDKEYFEFRGKKYYFNPDYNQYIAEDGESLPVSTLKYDPETDTNYAVESNGRILKNVAFNLKPVDVYAKSEEEREQLEREKRLKEFRRRQETTYPWSPGAKSSKYSPFHPGDLKTANVVGGWTFNLLSPTQLIRNGYNFATGKPTAFNEFIQGNNGLFTDKYAREHPWITMAGNIGADGLFLWSAGNKFNPNSMAKDAVNIGLTAYNNAEQAGRNIYHLVRYNAMPFDNPSFTFSTYPQKYNLFRLGDVDINRSLSSYRQLKPGGARNYKNFIDTDPHKAQYAPNLNNDKKGLLFRLNSDMPNPMYEQGSLWYGPPTKGFANQYPDLLVTGENLQFANSRSMPSSFDQAGRRIPYSDSQITKYNTNAYVFDPSYGYRSVDYFDGYQMPVTGNTNRRTVFYSRVGDDFKYYANKLKSKVDNATDSINEALGANVYARNMENNFRYNAFTDKYFYAEPVQEAITKTFENGGQPNWEIFREYKKMYPEYEFQFNNFYRTYGFQFKKDIPYHRDYSQLVSKNDWVKTKKNITESELSKDSGLGGMFLREGNDRAIYINDKSQLDHELEHWLQSLRDVDGNGSIYFPQQEKILNEAYIHTEGGIPEAKLITEKGAVNQQVREAILDKYYQENHVYPHNETILNDYIDKQSDATLKSILKNNTNAYGKEYVDNNLDFSKIRQALKYVPAVGGIGFFGTKNLNSTK